jgi:3-oxoacyl-[acyl-carrier protein] reductase
LQNSISMSVLTTDLRSHLALVTGASGGIGKATCLALASMGCSIAVHYHSSKSAAEDLVTQLEEKGVKAEAFKADLTKYDEVSLSAAPHSGFDLWDSKLIRSVPFMPR